MDLTVPGDASCMPTSLNFYFGFRIFESKREFVERQRLLCPLRPLSLLVESDFRLMRIVSVRGRLYRLKLAFSSSAVVGCRSWRPVSRGKPQRFLALYDIPSSRSWYHVEAVEWRDGVFRLLKGDGQILPFTDCTVEEYMEEAVTHSKVREICIYRYERA